MTASSPPASSESVPSSDAEVQTEISHEQHHVDRVYAELEKASQRAVAVQADGLARGRAQRTGLMRDEDLTGLFERDAFVFAAAKRQATIDTQYEGLVFGRLDLGDTDDESPQVTDIRYVGRLGVRDDDYEPLVLDWRAPAAAAFYRATPVQPLGVIRRRVLRCKGSTVVGVEDDLMVPEAPEDMAIVGDGALIAALTRTRGAAMRDIVATIQVHQDEAIRAPWRGVTEITGGPGTGKTVVALHRAAYLLYSERRRFESGGILVIGPSAAYTAYIERVLPSLGEDSVVLRALGDLVDSVTTDRPDSPEVAAIKGSLRIRPLLRRLAQLPPPDAPAQFRAFIAGQALRLDEETLRQVRRAALHRHPHNLAADTARTLLGDAAWRQSSTLHRDREEFDDAWETSLDVDAFLAAWWPQVDPRAALLRLADTDLCYRLSSGVLTHDEAAAIAGSYRDALECGQWSVADVPLIDELAHLVGPVQQEESERGFYEIDELDERAAAMELGYRSLARTPQTAPVSREDARERLLEGFIDTPRTFAHILIDEAQDLSPMQWRMIGFRGQNASWTVVGDAAQSSWSDPAESATARERAYGARERRSFHMTTNYRNAREIFEYAEKVILPVVPDADIPVAVRETGVEPVVVTVDAAAEMAQAADQAVLDLREQVSGLIAIITPRRYHDRLAHLGEQDQVVVIDPLSTKGLEYDATVVVDPAQIVAESPGGARVLYVVLTRAAHRMTVCELATS